MNVSELLNFKPSVPESVPTNNPEQAETHTTRKRKSRFDRPGEDSVKHSHLSKEDEVEDEKILKMLQSTDDTNGMAADDNPTSEISIRKLILKFSRSVLKNQEMRVKYPDKPEKFMDSEADLNEVILEMHILATVPELYDLLIEGNTIATLLQLLAHDNNDIAIAVVDLMKELTDSDNVSEAIEEAEKFVAAMLDQQLIPSLISNAERLNETVAEEKDAVYNTLGIIENVCELHGSDVFNASIQLATWILKRLKQKGSFDSTKLYVSEILSIILHASPENRELIGSLDGIDILLQQLSVYKRHNPSSPDEVEFMENIFDCLCCCLLLASNRDRFLVGEGLQLMRLMLREKKMSRISAIKVLDYAMTGPDGLANCQKFVDIQGLSPIFPLFMKPAKPATALAAEKTVEAMNALSDELEEHLVNIVWSLLKNCSGQQRQRVLGKFIESDYEKVDRLMELHFKFGERLKHYDERVKQQLKESGQPEDDEDEDERYSKRLAGGLFALQTVDLAIAEVIVALQATEPGVKQRVMEHLNLRGGSIKSIRANIKDYVANLGSDNDSSIDEKVAKQKQSIIDLLDKL